MQMSDKQHETSPANHGEVPDPARPDDAVPHAVPEAGTPSPQVPGESPVTEEAAVPEEAVVPEAVPLPLPGEILAAKRQERRMSIDEVSARIKLAPRQIVALEANDFAALPGMATTRGFIRSYARLLELDAEPLLAALADEPNPAVAPLVMRRPLPSPEFSGRRYAPPTSHRRDSRRLPALAAVMLVFVGTLAFVGYRQGWLELPSIELPGAGEAVAPSVDQEAPTSAQAPDTAAVAPPDAPPATAADAPAPAVVPASALQLVAREDAWVEVIAIDGERKLISKLMKAGTTELVEIAEPVVLVVGNAAGIDAVLRGQALNLKAAARDNVAKLSLK